MKHLVFIALAALLFTACDPTTSEEAVGFGDSCADVGFTSCGGDAVGDWTVKLPCTSWIGKDVRPIGEDLAACSGSTATRELTVSSGLLKLKADSSYEQSLTVNGTMQATMSEACADALWAGAKTLVEACAALEEDFGSGDDFFMPVSCSVTGTNCLCSGSSPMTLADSGTYVVSGSSLTKTPTDGEPITVNFCVKANELAIQDGESLVVYSK